ncbi:MAG: aminotransferase class IV [Thermoleophilia bacterium]
MRIVRINGRNVDPAQPALHVDDPLTRAGDGLIETMRARRGVVFRLERHLERLDSSAQALRLAGLPRPEAIRAEIAAAVAEAGEGDLRVRVAVSTAPTLWVEAESVPPLPMDPSTATAITVPGAWRPDLFTAEHKTASRAMWAWADRLAEDAGADAALLLDPAGRMGEATRASVFVRTADEVRTAPAQGLRAGVGREVMLEFIPTVVQRAAEAPEWRTAEEVVMVSALHGVVAVTRIDGIDVAGGSPGALAKGQQSAFRALVDEETGGA